MDFQFFSGQFLLEWASMRYTKLNYFNNKNVYINGKKNNLL